MRDIVSLLPYFLKNLTEDFAANIGFASFRIGITPRGLDKMEMPKPL